MLTVDIYHWGNARTSLKEILNPNPWRDRLRQDRTIMTKYGRAFHGQNSRIPAKTMRERITEQQAEIDYLTNQLKIIKAGDKAQTTSEKHANSDTGKDKSSFSSRKVVDMTAIAEVSAFRVAFDEHKLPLMLGNPEKLVSAIDKKLPKNKEIKEWGKPPQPPQHREPGYELETQEEFLRRQQQWDFNRETLIQRWHTKKENIMQACSAFRSEYVSVEQENFRVVVTAPVPRKMRPHIVWKFPEGFSVRNLDFKHYLPLFLEGLAETEPPYDFVAVQGVRDLSPCRPALSPSISSPILCCKD